jgi:hypothetical protein
MDPTLESKEVSPSNRKEYPSTVDLMRLVGEKTDHEWQAIPDAQRVKLQDEIIALSPTLTARWVLLADARYHNHVWLKPSTFDLVKQWLTSDTDLGDRYMPSSAVVEGLTDRQKMIMTLNGRAVIRYSHRLQIRCLWLDDLRRLLKEIGREGRQNIHNLAFDWTNILSPGSVKVPTHRQMDEAAIVFGLLAKCKNLKKLHIRLDPYRISHCPQISDVPTNFYCKLPQPRDLFQMKRCAALSNVRLGPDAEIILEYVQATRPPNSWVPPVGFLSGLQLGMLRPSPEHSNQKSRDKSDNVRAKRAKTRWERWLAEERQRFEWVKKAGREVNPDLL